MKRLRVLFTCLGLLACLTVGPPARATQPAPAQPSFKSGVSLVPLTAVVRDRKGRFVRNLTQADFEVIDRGKRRAIAEFRPVDSGPVSVAVVVDASGSMQVAAKLDAAREAAAHLLAWLDPGRDEVAVFAFDARLHELQGFTTRTMEAARALERVQGFGTTSLYDAIARAAERVAKVAVRRRALIVFTDGIDTSSTLSPGEVSGIASSIDVPIFVVAVDMPRMERPDAEDGPPAPIAEALGNLARWTGGELYVVTGPSQASIAARELLSELRHQYVIAFEAGGEPGWHPLEIRVRNKDLTVRARSGYIVQARPFS